MLFVHNLSWNTTELSIIPWSFPSYQGASECVLQTLNHPFRAVFQRGCSWTPDVSILCITLSFISLSCCVMCSVHKDVSSFDSWPYSSSQPGVIWQQATFGNFRNISTGRDQGCYSTSYSTQNRPPSKVQNVSRTQVEKPWPTEPTTKKPVFINSWSWNSMPWPSGWVIYLHSTPSPQGHMWVEE